MVFLTDSVLVDILICAITLSSVLYYYLKTKNDYWKNRGIPYARPNLLFGNLKDTILGRRNLVDIHMDIYNELSGNRFGGYFEMTNPNLLIRDPDLIERILIKDFNNFMDRSPFAPNVENDPLSSGLSNLSGNQWRTMRYKLTPTFTSGKLKGMFEQIYNCGDGLIHELDHCCDRGEDMDAREVLYLFTTDVIASCAFGLQFHHNSPEGKQFIEMAQRIFSPSLSTKIKFFILLSSKFLAKIFSQTMFPKDITEYYLNITKTTIESRCKSKVKRNDFLQLLINLREQEKAGKVTDVNSELVEEDAYLKQEGFKPENSSKDIEFTDGVLAGQAFLFLSAGSETVSSALQFTMYSIATNPEVQAKIHQEVDNVLAKHDNYWNYMSVKDMTYLDQVIQESLRIHPFVPGLRRICNSPYKIPNTDFIIEKGQQITIPVYAVHMDPKYYPNPKKFDPDRFENNNHKPSSIYLPFGNGPRMCIAMRFAVLEMKICLAKVMSKFDVSLSEKTTEPLQFVPTAFFPRVEGGMHLRFQKR